MLTRVAAAFHGGINEVLLTGLVVAVADWCRRRGRGGGSAVLIDLEGHGREEMFADVDLSRTVGWFTSLYPVRLDAGALDLDEALSGGPALGRALKLIKEQLRRCRTMGSAMGCCAISTRETGVAACRALRCRRSGSTIWGGLRRAGSGLGGGVPRVWRWAAAATRRCRWRTRSRSMR